MHSALTQNVDHGLDAVVPGCHSVVKNALVISCLVFLGVFELNLWARQAKVHVIKEPLDSRRGAGLSLAGQRDVGARLVSGHHRAGDHLWVTRTVWPGTQSTVTLIQLSSTIHNIFYLIQDFCRSTMKRTADVQQDVGTRFMAHAIGHRAHEGSPVVSGHIGDGQNGTSTTKRHPISSLRDHRAIVGPDIRQGGALGDGAGEDC